MPAPSLQALLAGVIDYAGLFPPAKLPLEPAWQNFRTYQQSPLAWMLGRFVCPADKLADLPPEEAGLLRAEDVSVLGIIGNDDTMSWNKGWWDVKSAIKEFGEIRRLRLDAIEIRAPQQQPRIVRAAVQHLQTMTPEIRAKFVEAFGEDRVREHIATAPSISFADVVRQTLLEISATALFWRLTTFLEQPLKDDWQGGLATIVSAIREHQRTQAGAFRPVGLKLRTGGLEAAAFPSIEQIAAVIIACRDAGVFWKATAGLHHPIRHFNAGVQTKMHGFINVLAADVLAHVHGLNADEVAAIVAEEDAGKFSFGDALTWRGPAREYSATASQIAAVRARSLQSFGSCSFDEPIEDLRALGWLEA